MKKFNIGWGLTNLCNMNCKFCYSKETREKSKDITIDDWKKFVDENYEQIDSITEQVKMQYWMIFSILLNM